MPEPLTAEEVEALNKAMSNLGSAYWKQIFSYAHVPIRNHAIAREQVKKAYEQLKAVVEKWA
jgi:hypothetical protein